ncbi:MAG: hypothetical protein RIB02_12405 [Vicingaceae bacterium]
MVNIAHIVNPVNISSTSDLFEAQPVTFESMLNAKKYSKFKENIFQYAIGFDEDIPVFPNEFIQLPSMKRSILDTGKFAKKRKLPLIKDILLPLLKEEQIDYIIYTNVDIAVLPFFYDFIFDKISRGSDSLIINRRVIDKIDSSSAMFAEIGDPHPGYDCFVFKKEILNSFKFENVCIGANWIGRTMLSNLVAFSSKLEILKDKHLTFHIGDDGAWLSNDFSEFDKNNKKETYKVIEYLQKVVSNEELEKSLAEILDFMDNFGIKRIKKPSIIKRVKNKIIYLLK